MSESKNGKPRRPRNPSQVARAARPGSGPDESTPDPADRPAGLLGSQASPVKTDGPYGGFARNDHGHFGRGNKAAAGNGNARRMQEYRRQFLEAIHEGTIPALARKLQHDALK